MNGLATANPGNSLFAQSQDRVSEELARLESELLSHTSGSAMHDTLSAQIAGLRASLAEMRRPTQPR